MEWTDRGLVLAKGVFRENDVWLRVLFREHGTLMVSAFGGLRSRRRFVGCLDVLNVLECRVRENRGFQDLTEAVLVRGPGILRERPKAQGLAMNFLKLVDSAGFTRDLAPDILRLLEESLEILKGRDDLAANTSSLSLFFRLKFMAILGYAPDFLSCNLCARPLLDRSFFSVEEGAVLCPDCFAKSRAKHSGAWLEPSTLCLLQEARDTWPCQWAGMTQDAPQASPQLSQAAGQEALPCDAGGEDGPGTGCETRLVPLDAAAMGCGSVDESGCADDFDADEMAETARVLALAGKKDEAALAGLFAFLADRERKGASLCVDGMLSYHVGLAWDKGRYVRT